MKKGVMSDLIIWIIFLLVGMLVRPYLSPRLDGAFVAFTVSNIVGGLIVGIIWILLRVIVHNLIPKAWPKWLFVVITVLLVPFSLGVGRWFFDLFSLDARRSILMFPLFAAGFAWGIYSEVKSA